MLIPDKSLFIGKRSHRPFMDYAFFLLLLVCGFLLFSKSSASEPTALNDFIEYWTAGRIFLHGGNPYDQAEMMSIQRNMGWAGSAPLMMWNPPWTLVLIAPLASLPFDAARSLWLLVSMLLILWAADWLWSFFGGPASFRWLGWLGTLVFIPNGSALYLGQISPFLLFGLVGFLWAIQNNRFFLAGVASSFMAIKPQVLYLFWLFLLFWTWRERHWKSLLGVLSTLMLCTIAVSSFDASLLAKYYAAIASSTGPLIWQTPTWGIALRMVFQGSGQWIRFIPTILGICFSVWLWFRWQKDFAWRSHLAPILLASIITSSFTWMFDWVVLLPVILLFLVWFQATPRRLWWLPAGYMAIELIMLCQSALARSNFYSIWMPPALAALFLVGRSHAAYK